MGTVMIVSTPRLSDLKSLNSTDWIDSKYGFVAFFGELCNKIGNMIHRYTSKTIADLVEKSPIAVTATFRRHKRSIGDLKAVSEYITNKGKFLNKPLQTN